MGTVASGTGCRCGSSARLAAVSEACGGGGVDGAGARGVRVDEREETGGGADGVPVDVGGPSGDAAAPAAAGGGAGAAASTGGPRDASASGGIAGGCGCVSAAAGGEAVAPARLVGGGTSMGSGKSGAPLLFVKRDGVGGARAAASAGASMTGPEGPEVLPSGDADAEEEEEADEEANEEASAEVEATAAPSASGEEGAGLLCSVGPAAGAGA